MSLEQWKYFNQSTSIEVFYYGADNVVKKNNPTGETYSKTESEYSNIESRL